MFRSIRRGGFTLIEALVTCAIAGLLLGVIVIIYTVEARTLAKVSTQVDVLQGLQILQARIAEDAQASTVLGVSADPTLGCIALLSAKDDDGAIVQDAQNHFVWQRYRIYYYRAPDQTVAYRELKLVAPSSSPVFLTDYDDGSGVWPLAHYATAGNVISRQVSKFMPSVNGSVVNVNAQGQQLRAGSDKPETVSLQGTIHPRN